MEADITHYIALWLEIPGDSGTRHPQYSANDFEAPVLADLNLRCQTRGDKQI